MTALPPEVIVPKLHGKAVRQAPEFETKVRLAGVGSDTETPVASPGPGFDTVVVYEMLFPATEDGDATLVIERSAGGFPLMLTRIPLEGEPAPLKLALYAGVVEGGPPRPSTLSVTGGTADNESVAGLAKFNWKFAVAA